MQASRYVNVTRIEGHDVTFCRSGCSVRDLTGVGICCPGEIDPELGQMKKASNFRGVRYPLGPSFTLFARMGQCATGLDGAAEAQYVVYAYQ